MRKYVAALRDAFCNNWLLLVLLVPFLFSLLLAGGNDFILSLIQFMHAWLLLFLPLVITILMLQSHGDLKLRIFEFFLYYLPWFLAVAIYENLTSLTAFIAIPLADNYLYSVDAAILGGTPSVYLQQFISPALTYLLFWVYILVYTFPPVLFGVYLFMKQGNLAFSEYSHAIVICLLTGFVMYLLVPGIGPTSYFSHMYTRDLYAGTTIPPDAMSNIQAYPKNAFPSMHTALSTLVLIYAWKRERKVAYVLLPLTLLLWFSTLYLRQHYFVDLVAGWALAGAVCFYTPAIFAFTRSVSASLQDPGQTQKRSKKIRPAVADEADSILNPPHSPGIRAWKSRYAHGQRKDFIDGPQIPDQCLEN